MDYFIDENDFDLDIDNYNKEESEIVYYNHNELASQEEISQWLYSMGVFNFTIHDDLTVTANDHVFFYMLGLKKIPIQFRRIKGDLFIGGNYLKSIKGLPMILDGMLTIAGEQIESLQYLPQKIGGAIKLYNNQKLHDLRSELKFCDNIIESSTFFEAIKYLSYDEYLEIYTYEAIDYIHWLKNLDDFLHDKNKYEI
jgi:hypothetical protein